MVAGFHELLVAFDQVALEIVRVPQSFTQQRRGDAAQSGIQRVDEEYAPFVEQAPQQALESFAKRCAGRVSALHQSRNLFAEREGIERGVQLLERRVRDRDAAHRTLRFRTFDLETNRFVSFVEDVRVVDFGEVVILGRQPENGDRGNVLVVEVARETCGRQCFVNRVRRAREQADLLPGDYRHGARPCKQIERRVSLVLGAQCLYQRGATILGIIQCVRCPVE